MKNPEEKSQYEPEALVQLKGVKKLRSEARDDLKFLSACGQVVEGSKVLIRDPYNLPLPEALQQSLETVLQNVEADQTKADISENTTPAKIRGLSGMRVLCKGDDWKYLQFCSNLLNNENTADDIQRAIKNIVIMDDFLNGDMPFSTEW